MWGGYHGEAGIDEKTLKLRKKSCIIIAARRLSRILYTKNSIREV